MSTEQSTKNLKQEIARLQGEQKKVEKSLLEREERLEQMAANVPCCIFQLKRHADASLSILYISQSAEVLFELPLSNLQNISDIFELIHPEDLSEVIGSLEQSAAEQKTRSLDFRITTPSGKTKFLRAGSSLQAQQDGSSIWNGVVFDITNYTLIEEDLRLHNRYLKVIHDISQIIAQCQSLNESWQKVVDIIAAASGFPMVSIAFYNPTSRTVTFQGAKGLGRDVSRGHTVPVERTMCAATVLTGQPLIVEDTESEPVSLIPTIESDVRRFLSFPLSMNGQVLGALSLGSPKKGAIREALILSASGLSRDLSSFLERKQAQDALKESEAKFRAIFEESPLGIAMVSMDNGLFAQANKSFCELIGYSEEELRSLTIKDITHPADREELVSEDSKPKAFKGSAAKRFISKDGRIHWVKINAKTLQIDGAATGLGVVEDVTETRMSEESLREREALLNSIFTTVPIGLGTTSNLALEKVNENFCRMLGYSMEELEGASLRMLYLTNDEYLHYQELLAEGLASGRAVIEAPWRCKDGRVITVKLSASLLDPNVPTGRITFAVADITSQKEAEKQATLIQDHLRALAGALASAEEKERRRIASGLHDSVAQILALCKIKAGLLKKSTKKEDNETLATELTSLLEQIIAEVRSLTFEISPPILYELGLVPAIEFFLEQFESKHDLRCFFEQLSDIPQISLETSSVLFHAFRELLNNVLKHANAQSITVSALVDRSTLKVSVTDDGCGFLPESISSDNMTLKGFGLFNIRERLRLIGGSLDVVSTPGSGSTITLISPILSNGSGQGLRFTD